jgi:hypothetical protein
MSKTHDDPSAAPTAYVTAIFAVLVIISVVALNAYYGHVRAQETQRKLVDVPAEALQRMQAAQTEMISGYRVEDPGTGRVAIPIERAMELVAAELAATER